MENIPHPFIPPSYTGHVPFARSRDTGKSRSVAMHEARSYGLTKNILKEGWLKDPLDPNNIKELRPSSQELEVLKKRGSKLYSRGTIQGHTGWLPGKKAYEDEYDCYGKEAALSSFFSANEKQRDNARRLQEALRRFDPTRVPTTADILTTPIEAFSAPLTEFQFTRKRHATALPSKNVSKKYTPIFSIQDPGTYEPAFISGYTGHIPLTSDTIGTSRTQRQVSAIEEVCLKNYLWEGEKEGYFVYRTDDEIHEMRETIKIPFISDDNTQCPFRTKYDNVEPPMEQRFGMSNEVQHTTKKSKCEGQSTDPKKYFRTKKFKEVQDGMKETPCPPDDKILGKANIYDIQKKLRYGNKCRRKYEECIKQKATSHHMLRPQLGWASNAHRVAHLTPTSTIMNQERVVTELHYGTHPHYIDALAPPKAIDKIDFHLKM